MMDCDDFQRLTPAAVADIVRERGPMVCVFLMNGTRRWFHLEHGSSEGHSPEQYLEVMTGRMIELCRMFFEHGCDTLILPMFNSRLLGQRGDAYRAMATAGMARLATHPGYQLFYGDYDVNVRFYGLTGGCLPTAEIEHLTTTFATVSAATANNTNHRLLWGVCVEDPAETAARLAIAHYRETGATPTRGELVARYFGCEIPPVTLYISSSKTRAFGVPLLTTGREDLYHTVAPSPYLDQTRLRAILYDHLFAREKSDVDYHQGDVDAWAALRSFYLANQDNILGVGAPDAAWGLWHPRQAT